MAKPIEENVLYFRLRLPRPLGDAIADLAWRNRRSANAQTVLLLEQALGWETAEDALSPASAGKGARGAGASRSAPATRAEAAQIRERWRRGEEAEREHRREMAEIPDPPGGYKAPPANAGEMFSDLPPIIREEIDQMRRATAEMRAVVEALASQAAGKAPQAKAAPKKAAARKTPAKRR